MSAGKALILRDVVRSMVESGEYIIARNSWLTGKNKEFLSTMGKTAKTDVVLKRVPPWAKTRGGPAAAPMSIQAQWYKMMKAHEDAKAQNLAGNARRAFVATRLAGKIADNLKVPKREERAAQAARELEQRFRLKGIDPATIIAGPATVPGGQRPGGQVSQAGEFVRPPPKR